MLAVQYSAAPPVPARVRLELTAPRPAGAEMSYAFILRLLRQLRALGVRELGLAYFGDAAGCRWLPEAIRHARETLGFESVFLTASTRMATPRPVRRLSLPCAALFSEAVVTCDAHLCACPYDRDPRFAMGDLTCETFLECWHGERFQRLREAHLARDVRGTPCEGCSAYA